MRVYTDNDWASLRVPVVASGIAMLYSSLTQADETAKMEAACFARSQLGYVFGDTGARLVV